MSAVDFRLIQGLQFVFLFLFTQQPFFRIFPCVVGTFNYGDSRRKYFTAVSCLSASTVDDDSKWNVFKRPIKYIGTYVLVILNAT